MKFYYFHMAYENANHLQISICPDLVCCCFFRTDGWLEAETADGNRGMVPSTYLKVSLYEIFSVEGWCPVLI